MTRALEGKGVMSWQNLAPGEARRRDPLPGFRGTRAAATVTAPLDERNGS